MSILLHGDCLELMKTIDDKSIDLIFCDLPYGQTSCKWDCCIDLDIFWLEVMRIKKLNTPIFMTTTTKFGVSLINSAPKKCHFRYDIVWVKSSPAGFLSAKKMPMRKHEMVYVFYEKLPFYDLSSHTHKFVKERNSAQKNGKIYEGEGDKKVMEGKYDPPLPVSVVKEEDKGCYGEKVPNSQAKYGQKCAQQYDPPLPVSVVKEETGGGVGIDVYDAKERFKNGKLTKHARHLQKGDEPLYDPPLPTSMLEVKSTKGKHSTEKPVALMEWVLKYYSREGDTILDPTMGSGSTGVACKNMNRNFIGIEKDPEIYEVAVNRIEG
tara:strand:+ start:84 stop:1049 length:966 start_codon:yes stop_codon:yes gene_type:complete